MYGNLSGKFNSLSIYLLKSGIQIFAYKLKIFGARSACLECISFKNVQTAYIVTTDKPTVVKGTVIFQKD